jgi:hypothetical protein
MTEPLMKSRRNFLKASGIFLGTSLVTACAPEAAKKVAQESNEMVVIEPGPEAKVKIKLGPEQPVGIDLPWSPDTRTSWIPESEGTFNLYFSADKSGYIVNAKSLVDIGGPTEYVKPSREEGKYGVNGYRAPSTVFKDGSGVIWSIEHLEEWQSLGNEGNFTARIALSKSTDDGNSWQDCGVILDGSNSLPAGEKVSGAGQPSAIIIRESGIDMLYMYYTNWNDGADSIRLAKAPLSQIDNPDAWQKLNDDRPVIVPPEGEIYAAIANVSFNTKLGEYLALFETTNGFWLVTSRDGVTWEDYQQITQFPEAANARTHGTEMDSYATLLSFNSDDPLKTTAGGYMVYAKGHFQRDPFMAVSRTFEII